MYSLEGLKVGDTVYYRRGSRRLSRDAFKVVRVVRISSAARFLVTADENGDELKWAFSNKLWGVKETWSEGKVLLSLEEGSRLLAEADAEEARIVEYRALAHDAKVIVDVLSRNLTLSNFDRALLLRNATKLVELLSEEPK